MQVAVCGMRCIDLNIDALKILGINFCYKDNLKEESRFYKNIRNIQSELKKWKI